jgi:hypothetical protein
MILSSALENKELNICYTLYLLLPFSHPLSLQRYVLTIKDEHVSMSIAKCLAFQKNTHKHKHIQYIGAVSYDAFAMMRDYVIAASISCHHC